MKKLTRYHKRIRLTYIAAAFICCFVLLLLFNPTSGYASGLSYYVVRIDGEEVGACARQQDAETALADARVQLSREAESIV